METSCIHPNVFFDFQKVKDQLPKENLFMRENYYTPAVQCHMIYLITFLVLNSEPLNMTHVRRQGNKGADEKFEIIIIIILTSA